MRLLNLKLYFLTERIYWNCKSKKSQSRGKASGLAIKRGNDMDVYEIVTKRIIEQLEQGVIPWKKPWIGKSGAFNRISRKPYSVLNQMLLHHSGEYATFRQWVKSGGRVKKGEKSEVVVFWKLQEVEEEDEKEEGKKKKIPILRYYHVFHISQVENVMPLEEPKTFETEPIEEAEHIFREYVKRENIKVSIIEQGNEAYYSPATDEIVLPCINQFEKAEAYYSVAFHEATHSTLEENRCNRVADNMGAHFGNAVYSKEELTAEIGSACILHNIGIETTDTFENSAAYVQNWLQVLNNDKKFIVSAASRAEKAVKYILNDQSS